MGFILQVLAGLLGGVAAALQGPFTGIMGQKVGDLTSVFVTYCGGAVVIAAVVLASGGGNLSQWRTLPWYVFLAGPLGLVIIWSLSYTVPRLGATGSTLLFILSWLACSVVIDHFGWIGVSVRPFGLNCALGIGALLVGAWLVLR